MGRPMNRTHTIKWSDPKKLAEIGSQLSGMEMMRRIMAGAVPPPPIMLLMNGRPTKISEGAVIFEAEPAEYHYNPIGMVHGGFAATMLDTVMGCAIHTTLPAGVGYTTLEIKINYIRPLTDALGKVFCHGTAVHVGNRVATAEGKIVDAEGKLYATGTTTCLMIRR